MQKSENFFSTSETEQRNLQKVQKLFFVKKRLYEHLEGKSDNPPPKSLTKNSREIQKQKHPKKFLWTSNLPLKERSQSFCPCPNVFRSKSGKQKRVFLKTLFCSKYSTGRIERKFGHTANFFQPKF